MPAALPVTFETPQPSGTISETLRHLQVTIHDRKGMLLEPCFTHQSPIDGIAMLDFTLRKRLISPHALS